jgi:hypothetical protein
MVNSVTACSEAATVLPGSTVRVSTTPSAGAVIEALARLVWSVDRAACASCTPARALVASATARVPRGTSSVQLGGGRHLPARQARHLLEPAQAACASWVVAAACATLACAAATAACERRIWSCRRAVSSTTSTWPFFTGSFTSTRTSRTVPESSLPMVIARVGCNVPLAVTSSVRSPRATGSVT